MTRLDVATACIFILIGLSELLGTAKKNNLIVDVLPATLFVIMKTLSIANRFDAKKKNVRLAAMWVMVMVLGATGFYHINMRGADALDGSILRRQVDVD